ncbi:MAG: N-acetyltransferase family protein [Clostridia bacterium]|nr:N-acetyltransferase family protein [Clostridia bacterium]
MINQIIRSVKKEDAQKLADIYAPYVENTAVSFEYKAPSAKEFEGRIEKITKKYPFIVIEENCDIKGYAYASEFKNREAYDFSVELSVYVDEKEKHKGYGRMLYNEIEKRLKEQNILNLYACIAYTECEDEYLTNDSMKFHEHMGFKLIGTFHSCGYKFNRWYDMIWMEKIIGEHNRISSVK